MVRWILYQCHFLWFSVYSSDDVFGSVCPRPGLVPLSLPLLFLSSQCPSVHLDFRVYHGSVHWSFPPRYILYSFSYSNCVDDSRVIRSTTRPVFYVILNLHFYKIKFVRPPSPSIPPWVVGRLEENNTEGYHVSYFSICDNKESGKTSILKTYSLFEVVKLPPYTLSLQFLFYLR